MDRVIINLGFQKLKGNIIGEENGKFIVELEDKSRVIVEERQIERGV